MLTATRGARLTGDVHKGNVSRMEGAHGRYNGELAETLPGVAAFLDRFADSHSRLSVSVVSPAASHCPIWLAYFGGGNRAKRSRV